MQVKDGVQKMEELNQKVLQQVQVGEVSVGMADFQKGDVLSDDEFDKVLAMMNKGAQKKGYSDVKEQVKTITEQSKQMDPFADMKVMSRGYNREFVDYMNEERNQSNPTQEQEFN